MSRETQEKTIDGYIYQVNQLSAPVGRRLFFELKALIGPSVAELLKGVGDAKSGKLMDMDMGWVASAVAAISEDVTPGVYQGTYETLASQTMFGEEGTGKFVPLEKNQEHFKGRFMSEFKWMAFALEVNYSDFLGALEALKNAFKSKDDESDEDQSQSKSQMG